MKWQASAESELISPRIAEPAFQSRTKPAPESSDGDWLCAWCLNGIANEKDRFLYEGEDEFSFTNPQGIHFEIITFMQTLGCQQSGVPTLDHTWFAGHAWSFCHCDRCGVHLGWYYEGQQDFVGLIKARLVRSLCLRN